MARALIVGCGCRGGRLGTALAEGGWIVRGTTREQARLGAIAAIGVEPAIADPDSPATVLELVADVAVAVWLLGSAEGSPELLAAIHGPRLQGLLAKLVDTPVRGFVYEAAGSVHADVLEQGAGIVSEAGERWRIPVEVVRADPSDHEPWLEAMTRASSAVLAAD